MLACGETALADSVKQEPLNMGDLFHPGKSEIFFLYGEEGVNLRVIDSN